MTALCHIKINATANGKTFYAKDFKLCDGDTVNIDCSSPLGELMAQRDELLAALRQAIPALVQCERAYRLIGAAVGQGEFERALIKAQALVAKHQPPAAPAASAT